MSHSALEISDPTALRMRERRKPAPATPMIEATILWSMALLAVRLECFSSLCLPDGLAYPISAMMLLVSICADCEELLTEVVMIQTHHRHAWGGEKQRVSLMKMGNLFVGTEGGAIVDY